jgi:hypothetical protein
MADGRLLSGEGLASESREDLLHAYHDFSTRRIEYGGLLPPDAFAEALFAAYPDEEGTQIVLKRIGLARQSSRIEELETSHYEYQRKDF